MLAREREALVAQAARCISSGQDQVPLPGTTKVCSSPPCCTSSCFCLLHASHQSCQQASAVLRTKVLCLAVSTSLIYASCLCIPSPSSSPAPCSSPLPPLPLSLSLDSSLFPFPLCVVFFWLHCCVITRVHCVSVAQCEQHGCGFLSNPKSVSEADLTASCRDM